jgi:hypothetical protein
MPDSKREGAPPPKGGEGRAAQKRDRLASALRENLKRRKAQARARGAPGQGSGGGQDSA